MGESFNESVVEGAALNGLAGEGYPVLLGPAIAQRSTALRMGLPAIIARIFRSARPHKSAERERRR